MAKPKQTRIPGTEDDLDEAIEAAAEKLEKIRGRRMKLTAEEVQAAEELKALMMGEKKKNYRHGTLTVELVTEAVTKVKVRRVEEETEEGGDE